VRTFYSDKVVISDKSNDSVCIKRDNPLGFFDTYCVRGEALEVPNLDPETPKFYKIGEFKFK
jgi:hypothetical protein